MHKKENVIPKTQKIQWHPGFYAAAELELRSNQEELEFHREYNLSKKPLQIDLLVIEKLQDVQIENEIGRLFRKYNIVEYKSPEDGMNIDDFFKVIGYAYLYKGLGEKTNQIPLEKLTVSFFRGTKPVKMMKELVRYGCEIQRYAPGIYYVEGMMIPVQIIVTKELKPKEHSPLKVLAMQVEETDVYNFAEYARTFKDPGDRRNADAVLQVSVTANKELYDQIKRRDSGMCDAIRELFKEEFEDAMEKGENRLNMLYSKLEQDGRREEIFRAMKDPEFLKKLYKEYGME